MRVAEGVDVFGRLLAAATMDSILAVDSTCFHSLCKQHLCEGLFRVLQRVHTVVFEASSVFFMLCFVI